MTGLTLGDKQAMTGEVKERFRQLGISHLLAVSGLHVGILFGILFWMFKPVERSRRGRWLRYALPVAMLWGYAAITGFTPSVVRATLMCSLYTVGLAVERQNTAAHTLTVTAFLLLLYRPSYLFDVGFQLSFAAVAFILLAVHLRRLWWPDLQGWKRWIADFVTVSTAAQIGTLPLTLYYFGSFQPLFLLSNLAAIPLVPFIMLFALATGALAFVGLEFAFPLFLLHSSLKLLTLTTHLGERWLGRAQITLLFDGCDLLFAYLFLGCLAIFFAFRLRKGAIAALGVALGWSLSHL